MIGEHAHQWRGKGDVSKCRLCDVVMERCPMLPDGRIPRLYLYRGAWTRERPPCVPANSIKEKAS